MGSLVEVGAETRLFFLRMTVALTFSDDLTPGPSPKERGDGGGDRIGGKGERGRCVFVGVIVF